MTQGAFDCFGHACMLAALVLVTILLRDWARVLIACAPKNRGRRLRAIHVGDGVYKLRISWRDRRGWVRGRESEWALGKTGTAGRPNPALVPWLAREWAALEKKRNEAESAKYADRLIARPVVEPDEQDDSDDLLDQLEADLGGVSSDEESDTENEPTILEATT